jgi:hypothetical protein
VGKKDHLSELTPVSICASKYSDVACLADHPDLDTKGKARDITARRFSPKQLPQSPQLTAFGHCLLASGKFVFIFGETFFTCTPVYKYPFG